MHPLDIDASPYILHTVCYSSRPKEPLIHAEEYTGRHSILVHLTSTTSSSGNKDVPIAAVVSILYFV